MALRLSLEALPIVRGAERSTSLEKHRRPARSPGPIPTPIPTLIPTLIPGPVPASGLGNPASVPEPEADGGIGFGIGRSTVVAAPRNGSIFRLSDRICIVPRGIRPSLSRGGALR
jgi:hypothetical protein